MEYFSLYLVLFSFFPKNYLFIVNWRIIASHIVLVSAIYQHELAIAFSSFFDFSLEFDSFPYMDLAHIC